MATKPTPRVNPRSGDRRGTRQLPMRRPSSWWYGIVLILLLGLAQIYTLGPTAKVIPYSEFKSLVKTGEVSDVGIGEQIIRGTTKKDGKPFTTTRVEDPKLTEELEARGIKYNGELVNRWLPDLLLTWIVPMILIFVVWGFLMRRLEERKIHVTLTDAAKEQLVREGFDPLYGARPLKRTIQRRVLDPLALRVLEGDFREGDTVSVDAGSEGLSFEKREMAAKGR